MSIFKFGNYLDSDDDCNLSAHLCRMELDSDSSNETLTLNRRDSSKSLINSSIFTTGANDATSQFFNNIFIYFLIDYKKKKTFKILVFLFLF